MKLNRWHKPTSIFLSIIMITGLTVFYPEEAFAGHTMDLAVGNSIDSTIAQGDTDVCLGSIDVSSTRNEMFLAQVTVHEYGTVDSTLITNLRAFQDTDGDGVCDAGEAPDLTLLSKPLENHFLC